MLGALQDVSSFLQDAEAAETKNYWRDAEAKFIDLEFPRSLHSLGGAFPTEIWRDVEWRRLSEVAPDATTLFVAPHEAGEIRHGMASSLSGSLSE